VCENVCERECVCRRLTVNDVTKTVSLREITVQVRSNNSCF